MYGQFFLLFAMIITGYLLRKTKFVDDTMNNGLNKFICYFAFPCMLVKKIGELSMDEMGGQFILMFALGCGLFTIYSVFAYIYAKLRKFPRRIANVAEIAMVAPNNGFMGLPISLLFFGEQGLFLMMAHNVNLNLFFFTYTLAALRRNNEKKGKLTIKTGIITLGKLIGNPNISAIILGLIIAYQKIPLNNLVGDYLGIMGSVATPMAMIYIGSTLAGSNFFEMFRNHLVWESALIKLMIFPLLTLILVIFLPIPPLIKAMLVLGAAFPTGATVTMLAQQEKQNADFASKVLFFTTMLSMITIPFIVKVIHSTII